VTFRPAFMCIPNRADGHTHSVWDEARQHLRLALDPPIRTSLRPKSGFGNEVLVTEGMLRYTKRGELTTVRCVIVPVAP